MRLDYLFIPGGFIGGVRACDVVDAAAPADASDHFPLCADLDV